MFAEDTGSCGHLETRWYLSLHTSSWVGPCRQVLQSKDLAVLSLPSANLTPSDLTHGALRLSSLAAPLAVPPHPKKKDKVWPQAMFPLPRNSG